MLEVDVATAVGVVPRTVGKTVGQFHSVWKVVILNIAISLAASLENQTEQSTRRWHRKEVEPQERVSCRKKLKLFAVFFLLHSNNFSFFY